MAEGWNKRSVKQRATTAAAAGESKRVVKQRATTIAPLGEDMELRTALIIAIGSAALTPLLLRVHPMGMLAGIPACVLISWAVWNGVSLCLWGRRFRPPSRYSSNSECKRSDWYLFVPHIVTLMSLLVACVAYGYWVWHEHRWPLW